MNSVQTGDDASQHLAYQCNDQLRIGEAELIWFTTRVVSFLQQCTQSPEE